MAWLCNRRGKLWYFAGFLFFLVIVFGVTTPDEALAFHIEGKSKAVNVVVSKDVIIPNISNNPNGRRLSANSFFINVVGSKKVTQIQRVSEIRILETDCSNRKFFSSFLKRIDRFTNAGIAGNFHCRVEPRDLGGSAAKVFDGEFRDAKFDIPFNRLTMALGDAKIDGNAGLTDRAVYKRPLQIDQSSLGNLSRSRCRIGASLGSINTINGGGGSFGGEYQGHDYCPDAYHAGDELIESPFGLFLGRYCGAPFLTILCIFAGWGACAMWFVWTGIMDKNRRLRWRLWVGLGIFGLAFWGDLVLTQAYFR